MGFKEGFFFSFFSFFLGIGGEGVGKVGGGKKTLKSILRTNCSFGRKFWTRRRGGEGILREVVEREDGEGL